MRTAFVIALFLALGAPGVMAQGTTKQDDSGASTYAPGQKRQLKDDPKEPGASEYAPGQRRQQKDDPKEPGASEYAPGQQKQETERDKKEHRRTWRQFGRRRRASGPKPWAAMRMRRRPWQIRTSPVR